MQQLPGSILPQAAASILHGNLLQPTSTLIPPGNIGNLMNSGLMNSRGNLELLLFFMNNPQIQRMVQMNANYMRYLQPVGEQPFILGSAGQNRNGMNQQVPKNNSGKFPKNKLFK
jgi:hypothetical protein